MEGVEGWKREVERGIGDGMERVVVRELGGVWQRDRKSRPDGRVLVLELEVNTPVSIGNKPCQNVQAARFLTLVN